MNDDGMDSLGVDHSNFSLRDEIAYQMNRVNNEARQRSILPQVGTTIGQTPTQNNNVQQLKMPAGSQYPITMPRPQEPSTWDKFKDWAENTGDAIQAGAVGYTTGATVDVSTATSGCADWIEKNTTQTKIEFLLWFDASTDASVNEHS